MSQGKKPLSSLLSSWKSKKKETTSNEIPKIGKSTDLLLSPSQRRLWFLQQLFPKNPFYNYSERHRIKGNLNIDYLLQSLEGIYAKHDVLRTSYYISEGEPFMKINPKTNIALKQFDFSGLDRVEAESKANALINEEVNYPFDLSSDDLSRFTLIKLDAKEYIFLVNLHHILMDEWSMGIFRKELVENYEYISRQNKLPLKEPLPVQYTDYAAWKNEQNIDEKQLAYWKSKLGGQIGLLNLPTDFKRPLTPSFKGKTLTKTYSREFSSLILDLAKELEITPYSFFLSVFYVFLNKYTGQKDILIGTPISNREKSSLEKVIGFFNDTVVLRNTIDGNSSFGDFSKEVAQTVLEAFNNKDVSFETLVQTLNPQRSLSINPFFQTMFLYNDIQDTLSFGNEVVSEYQVLGADVSKFDLTLFVSNENGIITVKMEYATDLFKDRTVERFQNYFEVLITEIIGQTRTSLKDIAPCTEEEENIFFTDPGMVNHSFFNFTGIHQIIEKWAVETPEAIALTFDDQHITYLELENRANSIAQQILTKTEYKKVIVGLCVERSIAMITGLLGILKAGCAYLPIDPDYPIDRITFMLMDSNAPVVLTTSGLEQIFSKTNCAIVKLDSGFKKIEKKNFPISVTEDTAYVIYTSGSTGNPKGVPISHGNIMQSTTGRLEYYPTNPSSFLLMSSISFDSSKAGIFWTLCTGGNLVITPKRIEQDIQKIEYLIQKYEISHILLLPSLYKVILENCNLANLGFLNTVIVAGEECTTAMVKTHFSSMPNTSLFNEYGPTEATVWCIAHHIEKGDEDSKTVPIGRPVAGATTHILDNDFKSVPFGAVGELYIGGGCLSAGYLNNEELTSSAFIQAPWSDDIERIIYKTGDLARYNVDGDIEFLGRADNQLKIRGFRVELHEIENVLLKNSMVKKAVVLADQSSGEETFIDEKISHEKMFSILEQRLENNEIEELIESVTALKDSEKEYLFKQIKNS
ncbi:non-ribosomal peptide synthetase [Maribacter sp. 2210JD10-5]|uniref:non-ribosomal peptide synthetase n=1 Tax=Maribacter sp. 2210JD10-5 TaxID=3386272 RepID=UPI0039BCBFD4